MCVKIWSDDRLQDPVQFPLSANTRDSAHHCLTRFIVGAVKENCYRYMWGYEVQNTVITRRM